jgi:hypothetical protein
VPVEVLTAARVPANRMRGGEGELLADREHRRRSLPAARRPGAPPARAGRQRGPSPGIRAVRSGRGDAAPPWARRRAGRPCRR